MKLCLATSCGGTHFAKGFCRTHYFRQYDQNRRKTRVNRQTGPLSRVELVKLRALVGVPPEGPTLEQFKRWNMEENQTAEECAS